MTAKTDFTNSRSPGPNDVPAEWLNEVGGKANTSYVKPGDGIPESDMTTEVQTSLAAADSALQAVPTTVQLAHIKDTNNVEAVTVVATADAVNNLQISNRATGYGPILESVGSNTDISLRLQPKGSGSIIQTVNGATDTTGVYKVDGAATNVSLDLQTKGAGTVKINGSPITVADAPRFILFATGWAARPDDDRVTFFLGGDTATDAPDDANLRTFDVWIPAS